MLSMVSITASTIRWTGGCPGFASQRAPSAVIQDSGVRAVYGRVPLPAAMHCVPQQAREDVFTVAVDERKCFLGLGPVIFPVRPELASPQLRPQEDYVVCIVGARRELFAGDLHALQPRALTALAAYEREMLCYGFAVVREAAEMGARLMGQEPLPA